MNAFTEFFGIRTRSGRMLRVIELIRRIADIEVPVLIQGETGTGKELIARAVHGVSRRHRNSLVTVNCAALPAGLVESEFFGHERGAFTGAERAFSGRAEAADGGTLFLDEVNSIPLEAQSKLLRFLETGEISRVGRAQAVALDVRLVCAANVPLVDEVARGHMREDFFQRLNTLNIDVPPLRDRLEDLPMLVQQCLEQDPVAVRLGVTEVLPGVLTQLEAYPWPGNVRELRNVVRRSLVFGAVGATLASVDLARAAAADQAIALPAVPALDATTYPPFRSWMKDREREYLSELQRRFPTASERAAAAGLPTRTLYRKVTAVGVR